MMAFFSCKNIRNSGDAKAGFATNCLCTKIRVESGGKVEQQLQIAFYTVVESTFLFNNFNKQIPLAFPLISLNIIQALYTLFLGFIPSWFQIMSIILPRLRLPYVVKNQTPKKQLEIHVFPVSKQNSIYGQPIIILIFKFSQSLVELQTTLKVNVQINFVVFSSPNSQLNIFRHWFPACRMQVSEAPGS